MVLSPCLIAWAPRATLRRPEPQSWLTPQAGTSNGTPALTDAWRAGFWPCPADRIWPMMTSETAPGSTPARSSAASIATWPRKWAGTLLSAPLKAPIGVRAALAITISDMPSPQGL